MSETRPKTITQVAQYALNGWAIYATRKIEIDDIALLWSELKAIAERSEPAAASVPLPPAASGGTQEFTAAEVEAEIAAEVIRRHGSHNAAICRMLRAYARLLSPSPAPTGAEGRKE
jgi:hypothetical protein